MFKLSPKILFLLLSIVMINGTTLKCEYDSSRGFYGIEGDEIYYCMVTDSAIFDGDSLVKFDSIEGTHRRGYSTSNVKGLQIFSISSLKYFPQNAEKIFNDLKVLNIYFTNLQEVSQQDLKVFPQLLHLSLSNNKITTINANLFDFNLRLRVIFLNDNQISHIYPHVFNILNNLIYLDLSNNNCENPLSKASESRSSVLQLIQRVNNRECSSVYTLEKQKEDEEQSKCSGELESALTRVSELQDKLRDLNDKYLNLYQTARAESNILNGKLNEWKDKYINLLQAKANGN